MRSGAKCSLASSASAAAKRFLLSHATSGTIVYYEIKNVRFLSK